MTLEQIACDYFLLLSRLEYALKISSYIVNDRGSAKPDWEGFITSVSPKMKVDTNDNDIRAFLDFPPRKQLFEDGIISWSNPDKITDNDSARMLQACLTIRNNLFHGGKHGEGNAGRNIILIKAATKILRVAIETFPDVRERFEYAEL